VNTRVMVVGMGVTGRAVANALVTRHRPVLTVDDHPDDSLRQWAVEHEIDLIGAPELGDWPSLLEDCGEVVVSPGIPDRHPVFDAAHLAGVNILDESDLAGAWDQRPWCAVTGTNGKTTVVTLVAQMLEYSGRRVATAGNIATPLVAAINDAEVEAFVVEASSFRLGHARCFTAAPAAWTNFSPDHLDHHVDLDAYLMAKSRIWEGISNPKDAVVNLTDPVLSREAPPGATGFGLATSTCRIEGGYLHFEDQKVISVREIRRSMPHDLLNAQAAAATALRFGAELEGCARVLRDFDGLAHRMSVVAEVGGIRFVNDSKATTPHATLAAVAGYPGAVLIAGGRNKGLDLSTLAGARPRAVVAIGEAASEIASAFKGRCPVQIAESMREAVEAAAAQSGAGGTVLLSPACASFDWYSSYEERGLEFTHVVAEMEKRR